MGIRWARSATKHRVSKERSRHVIKHYGLRFEVEPHADARGGADTRLLYLGDDVDGVPLEVMAVRGGEEMASVKPTRKTAAKSRRSTKAPVRTQSGVEVTPEVNDALAEEAEQGYDLSKAKRRRTGRPSLGPGGPSPRVTFRAAPELYRAAQARARREGRTMSELAREAFTKYIGGGR